MQIVRQETREGKVVVSFDGVIDETFSADDDFSGMSGEVFVLARKVTRINSSGAKRWIACFEKLKSEGVRVHFVAISPALVEQFNLISNFGGGHQVYSAVLPFLCKSCSGLNFVVQTKEESLSIDLEHITWPCIHCAKTELDFDDLPEEYFSFWKR